MSELDNNQRDRISSPNARAPLGRQRRRSIFLPIPPATMNLDNTMDFRNVCRVCASVTDNIVPILTGEGRRLNLTRKLSKHLKINVLEGDYPRLPVVLCMSCNDTLQAFDVMAGGVRVAEAALRQHSSLLQNRREIEQRQERINRNLQEHGVRRCPLCSAALATSRYSAHLRTRHQDRLFECSNCDMLVERHELLPHMKQHAENFASAWNVAWSEASTQLTGRPTTGEEIAQLVPQIVELEFSDSDIEDFEPYLRSALRTMDAPATSNRTPQEPEIVDIQDNPPQESLVSENSSTNPPQEVLVPENKSDNQPANPPQEFLGTENHQTANPPLESLGTENHQTANPPQESLGTENHQTANPPQESLGTENHQTANPPQESLISENPRAKSPVVLNNEPEKDGEEIKLKKKRTRSCPHCTRTFNASSSFFYHIKHFHKQSKEHACGKCGKRFGTRGMLREHASVHTGAREHQCGQCPKKFSTRASLYIHQQTHGAAKKFSCDRCPMAFRWNTQLQRHLARHAAERNHACATCGKAFSVRADLLRHGRTHARAEHVCPEAPCAARFAQPRYLRSHVTRKHANASRAAEK